jgi:hypothetical protein
MNETICYLALLRGAGAAEKNGSFYFFVHDERNGFNL